MEIQSGAHLVRYFEAELTYDHNVIESVDVLSLEGKGITYLQDTAADGNINLIGVVLPPSDRLTGDVVLGDFMFNVNSGASAGPTIITIVSVDVLNQNHNDVVDVPADYATADFYFATRLWF